MGVRPRVPGTLTPPLEGMGEREPAHDDEGRRTMDEVSGQSPPQDASSTIIRNPQSAIQNSVPPFQSTIRFSQTAFRIDQALPGQWHDTVDGPCFAVERRFPVGQVRGPVHLGSVLHTRPSTLWDAGRTTGLRDIDARRLLFLDTETTGLSGGTGTYVFLVGVAYFCESGDEVVLRQYFLSDVSAERALLHALNDLFRDFTAVVTFNGKTFDWPLLETRFTYNRLRSVLRDPPHLDMLGPSRRLWRDRLESCSLETLESQVLGVRRGFDVPGWRIPSLYFQYLRAGHIGHVLPVFEHNEHDLLTLDGAHRPCCTNTR